MIEQNPKLGYYQVGDEIFYSKPQAYIEASKHNLWPKWHFNLKTFLTFDWEIEPETNLRELYRIRAQQIRDKYDWIRVEASGGGDSTTAIYSFLLNGIHLDEVVFRYPKQGEKDLVGNPKDTRAENTLSEWDFAAKPLLNWIQTNYPEVKITVHDYSDNLIKTDYMKDESWVFTTRDWFQPGHGIKHDNFGTREHKLLADSGKKIGVVYGIDKPKLTIVNDEWYLYFNDVLANHPNPVVNEYENISSELFYWSPELPEMLAKQAHMVKSWFNMPGNAHLRNLVAWPNTDIARRTAYEALVKSIVYPDYDHETWQTIKPTNSFYNEMDQWFYDNFSDTKLYSAWEAGLKFLTDKIDDRLLSKRTGPNGTNEIVGLAMMTSPLYYLGPVTKLKTTPAFINQAYKSIAQFDVILVKNKKIIQTKV